MQDGGWRSEWDQELRTLVCEGHPAVEIARRINAQYGTAFTRSAVLGRKSRLGLSVPGNRRRVVAFMADDSRSGAPGGTLGRLCQYIKGRPSASDACKCLEPVASPGDVYCRSHARVCYTCLGVWTQDSGGAP